LSDDDDDECPVIEILEQMPPSRGGRWCRWDVMVDGLGEIVLSMDELRSYRRFHRACFKRFFHVLPLNISADDWVDMVNRALAPLRQREKERR
jgi:hypothetical protein